jgi:UDPglucose--hexose-1-phosphate uridylyltransferase
VVPRYAQWPIQLHIIPVQHIADLENLTPEVIDELANCMKTSLLGVHEMYSKEIPYIMSFYQSPVGVKDFHFHIEIISPQISEEKFKFRAGLETSLDIFINSTDMRDFVSKIKEVMP